MSKVMAESSGTSIVPGSVIDPPNASRPFGGGGLSQEESEVMFLTPDELQALTGYKRRGKQIAWLRKAGIPFIVSGAGFPVVALRELERRLIKDPKIRSPKDRPKLELVR